MCWSLEALGNPFPERTRFQRSLSICAATDSLHPGSPRSLISDAHKHFISGGLEEVWTGVSCVGFDVKALLLGSDIFREVLPQFVDLKNILVANGYGLDR